jgi:acetolactate synthase-1/2/3 large subunit
MVWEDGGYGMISWKQENIFNRHTDLSFNNPDWVKLAESFDWRGIRVENAADLKPALEAAFAETTPCLMAVPVDYRENRLLTQRLGNIVCPI